MRVQTMENKHVPYGPYEKYFKRPIDFCCGLAAVVVFCWLYLILIVLGVASHAIGAAPYLIRDGENGFLYRNGDTRQFCRRVEQLARDSSLCRTMGLKAYRTIVDTWNADIAAQRLLHFCEAILHQEAVPTYQEGPLSKAGFLSNHWYKGKD